MEVGAALIESGGVDELPGTFIFNSTAGKITLSEVLAGAKVRTCPGAKIRSRLTMCFAVIRKRWRAERKQNLAEL